MPHKLKAISLKLKAYRNILAIESSCDETAAAVLINGQIKSNIVASQIKIHAKYGGVVPEVAARSHITAIIPLIDRALKDAGINLNQINCIAVTQGPGLLPSLLVGIDTAKALSLALDIPLLPINHMEAHIYANFVGEFRISNFEFRIFPALILIVSGGHTMIVKMTGHGQYKILGETIDDAAGEAFDKTAKMLGLPYPGGPHLSRLAGKGNPQAFDFPRPLIHHKNLDFSFSGLKTSVLYTIQKLISSPGTGEARRGRDYDIFSTSPSPSYSRRGIINHKLRADLAASVQQAIVDVLIAKMEKAIAAEKPKTIMLGGGVAANKLLRDRFKLLSKSYKLKVSIPPLEYCTDNAGMIGLAGFWRLKSGHAKFSYNFDAKPNMELK
jgi:N6-L-threonylcarbamoyladenine synthase